MYCAKIRADKRAFTFVEIILVIGVLSVIGLAVFTAFSRGLQIWQKINEERVEEDVGLLFEKMSHDLNNSFFFSEIGFSGNPHKMRFPSLVPMSRDTEKVETVGSIEYSFDNNDHIVYRRYADYSDVYKERYTEERQMLERIENVEFRYYYFDGEREEFRWLENWPRRTPYETEEEIITVPLAVRVVLTQKRNDTNGRSFAKTVYIPQGWWGAWRIEEEEEE